MIQCNVVTETVNEPVLNLERDQAIIESVENRSALISQTFKTMSLVSQQIDNNLSGELTKKEETQLDSPIQREQPSNAFNYISLTLKNNSIGNLSVDESEQNPENLNFKYISDFLSIGVKEVNIAAGTKIK